MKTVSIVGARPQFVKYSAVARELRPRANDILVHTGQHYDSNLSDVFFVELDIPAPDYRLDAGSGTHAQQTGSMLIRIEDVLIQEKPDWVIVYGDTNSTLAGAVAAAKLNIPVAHVEAGLRSHNKQMPEEVNRILTDHASTLLLAPTRTAIVNLSREGFSEAQVHLVGDVMYDAILFYRSLAERQSKILQKLNLRTKTYLLTTIHRAENTDCPLRLRAIFEAFQQLSVEMPVVLPLHPRTRRAMQQSKINLSESPSLIICDPLGYLDMVILESHAALVLTDSGGIQKEAFFCGTPCVTLREETEWLELVESGWNKLVPPLHASRIREEVHRFLQTRPVANNNVCPYGEGDAAQKIVRILLSTNHDFKDLDAATAK